jgi:signal transduction histidine kinase
MTELIRAVLNYSRLSRTGVDVTDVDLNVTIDQLKTDLELFIEEKSARIVSEKLPVVKGIPLQLSQLFLNLLTNALKFSDRPPEITIRVLPITPEDSQEAGLPDKEGDFLKIVFADNGIGFEQQYANRLFSIFQRLHSSDSYAGTGIGLALCKKITENHGGAITVQSEPGKGTTFFIYLPYDKNTNEALHNRLGENVAATGRTTIR